MQRRFAVWLPSDVSMAVENNPDTILWTLSIRPINLAENEVADYGREKGKIEKNLE